MLSVKNLSKIYKTKGGAVTKALDNVSVDFPRVGMIFLLGRSGSGKSTLLNMIGGLDKPDEGEVIIKGKSSKEFTTTDFDSYRNTFIGFIFQEYNILNEFNVEQNIALALQLQGKKADPVKIEELLNKVDLKGVAKRKPNTLSGGQRQRIAIARALIKEPEIIMADEPTGALDSKTGKQVFETLKKLSLEKLVIIVSHDRDFARIYGDRIIELRDGKIISDTTKELVEPKISNENFSINQNGIIQIKNGTKLTQKDKNKILDLIEKNNGEVIISNSSNNNKEIKETLNIRDDGQSEVFNPTKVVKVVKYDGTQTKFIKSRMPFSRAFKMGVSGLKSKPIRLIGTILLSSISFAMFGIVSTLMLYDSSYTVEQSMKGSNYKTETIKKIYSMKNSNVEYNLKSGDKNIQDGGEQEIQGLIGISELNELNSKNNDKFIGTFKLNSYSNSSTTSHLLSFSSSFTPESCDYYRQYTYLTDLSDCGKTIMEKNFGTPLAGHYPLTSSGIAISNYTADLIMSSDTTKYTDYSKLTGTNNEIDNDGVKITFTGRNQYNEFYKEMYITGVYKIADIPSGEGSFDELKKSTSSLSSAELNTLNTSFNNFLNNGLFLTGFVNENFYNDNISSFKKGTLNTNYSMPSFQLKGVSVGFEHDLDSQEIKSDSTHSWFISKDLVQEQQIPIEYYQIKEDDENETLEKVDNIEIGDNEIILPIYNYYQSYTNSNEGFVYRLLHYLSLLGFDTNASTVEETFNENNPYFYGVKLSESTFNLLKTDLNSYKKAFFRLKNYIYSVPNYEGGDEQFNNDISLLKGLINKDYTNLYKNIYIVKTMENLLYNIEDQSTSEYENIRNAYQRIYGAEDSYLWKYNNQYKSASGSTLSGDLEILYNGINTYINESNNLKYLQILYNLLGNCLTLYCYSDVSTILTKYEFSDKLSRITSTDNPLSEEEFKKLDEIIIKYFKQCIGFDLATNTTTGHLKFDLNQFGTKPYLKTTNVRYKYKDYIENYGNIKVKGYYLFGSYNNTSGYMINNDFLNRYVTPDINMYYTTHETNYTEPSDAKYYNLMLKTDYSQDDIKAMLTKTDTYKYVMNNQTYTNIEQIVDLISTLKQVFLYVGIGTGVLAALLMANFISVSISSKKKDIGILRAVGAKGGDVFKIFYSESGVIAAICLVISLAGSFVTCYFLNSYLSETITKTFAKLGANIKSIDILNFNVINILIVVGTAVVISILATLIPVILAAKKPPVEAIRSL